MVATPGTAYGSADTTDQLSFQLNDPLKKNVYRYGIIKSSKTDREI